MENAIVLMSAIATVLGAIAAGVSAIIKLSRQIDRHFDETDRRIMELSFQKDGQISENRQSVALLELQFRSFTETINHKLNRFEAAIIQQSKFLEKHHSFSPRAVFPLKLEEDEQNSG
jgi:hypothetical protein